MSKHLTGTTKESSAIEVPLPMKTRALSSRVVLVGSLSAFLTAGSGLGGWLYVWRDVTAPAVVLPGPPPTKVDDATAESAPTISSSERPRTALPAAPAFRPPPPQTAEPSEATTWVLEDGASQTLGEVSVTLSFTRFGTIGAKYLAELTITIPGQTSRSLVERESVEVAGRKGRYFIAFWSADESSRRGTIRIERSSLER